MFFSILWTVHSSACRFFFFYVFLPLLPEWSHVWIDANAASEGFCSHHRTAWNGPRRRIQGGFQRGANLKWLFWGQITGVLLPELNSVKSFCYCLEKSTLAIPLFLTSTCTFKGAKICRREWYESNSKKASNDKGFSWWYFWRYLFSLIILFHLNSCFLLLNIDLGPTVGGVRISGCENQL